MMDKMSFARYKILESNNINYNFRPNRTLESLELNIDDGTLDDDDESVARCYDKDDVAPDEAEKDSNDEDSYSFDMDSYDMDSYDEEYEYDGDEPPELEVGDVSYAAAFRGRRNQCFRHTRNLKFFRNHRSFNFRLQGSHNRKCADIINNFTSMVNSGTLVALIRVQRHVWIVYLTLP